MLIPKTPQIQLDGYSEADNAIVWLIRTTPFDTPEDVVEAISGLVFTSHTISHSAADFDIEAPFRIRVKVGVWTRRLYTGDIALAHTWLSAILKIAAAAQLHNELLPSSKLSKKFSALAAMSKAKAAFDKL